MEGNRKGVIMTDNILIKPNKLVYLYTRINGVEKIKKINKI